MENLCTHRLLGQVREVDGQSFLSSWEAIAYLANKVDEAGGADPQSAQSWLRPYRTLTSSKLDLLAWAHFAQDSWTNSRK